jgi:hypothetical protein
MEVFDEPNNHTFITASFVSAGRCVFHLVRNDFLWGLAGFGYDQAFIWTHWYLVALLAKEEKKDKKEIMTMINLMPVSAMTARGVNDNRIALNRGGGPEFWVDNTTNLLLLGLATYNTLDRKVSWVS